MKIYWCLSRVLELGELVLFNGGLKVCASHEGASTILQKTSSRVHISHEREYVILKTIDATWNPYNS